MSASYTKSTVHLHIPNITSSPYIWIELAQPNIHCYHASIMAWDWKCRIKWCSSCTAPAKWKWLPYFCPGLGLSCRLGVDHLMNTPQPFTILPAMHPKLTEISPHVNTGLSDCQVTQIIISREASIMFLITCACSGASVKGAMWHVLSKMPWGNLHELQSAVCASVH